MLILFQHKAQLQARLLAAVREFEPALLPPSSVTHSLFLRDSSETEPERAAEITPDPIIKAEKRKSQQTS